VVLPNEAAVAAIAGRVAAAGIPTEPVDHGFLIHDPAKNAICVTRLA
jgi:hypothetical protein